MIACTKLLCGTATVREALSQGLREDAGTLHFTRTKGPLVVWNITRRCNLRCRHCYSGSVPGAAGHELSRDEGFQLIADLRAANVPVLLFSGGEPLMREDVFEWIHAARVAGLHPVLSTNGTLITDAVAARLVGAGLAYAGISLDGTDGANDAFRGERGAFAKALAGLRAAKKAGLRTGLRFTVCAENIEELPKVFDLAEAEAVPRVCIYHLVYSGRGSTMRDRDLSAYERQMMVDLIIEKTLDWARRRVAAEILTVDCPADGVYLANFVRREMPSRLDEVKQMLDLHGGCSAGTKFASIDAAGNVHPCQFWDHVTLGNVKACTFREIWRDTTEPLMHALKQKARHLSGPRCGKCVYRSVCGGCRVRAEVVAGSPWADDPACYIADKDIKPQSP